jgi:predicted AAA+ superfamily ATPase
LLNEVQKLLDSHQQDELVFILSGSSARKLKVHDANLLAGRALTCSLSPFSLDEVELLENLPENIAVGNSSKMLLIRVGEI